MGKYTRDPSKGVIGGRHVYSGPTDSGFWLWFYEPNSKWCFGSEKNIGTGSRFLSVKDKAMAPELISASSTWKTRIDKQWHEVSGMAVKVPVL
jgi:hypothetical protein